jgi:hypothetical protein
MPDEIATGSAGASDGGRHSGRDPGEQSPLQTRAQFLKNWSWELVISFNQGACSRGSAQHGFNRETQEATAREWSEKQQQVLSFEQTIEFLRICHRKAPFLFFNGNTFADIGRQLSAAAFADLPQSRRREVTSAIAHYIAGVLDRDSMVQIVESLCESADWKAGDRIKTMRGTTHGVIVKILDDGRVVWKPDGSESELIALPESLIREKSQ